MPFNSFNFWLVFPVLFCLYWALPIKWQNVRKAYLIIVSYALYMLWKPAFALVLLAVTAVTYLGGNVLQQNDDTAKNRKRLGWTFALLSLLPLLVFKYYNFINDSVFALLSTMGLHFRLPGLNWAIPVGISFFTFQAVGYLLDVYHKRIASEKNFWDYTLFLCFFPQVTSGPISKASELLPQIKLPHPFDYGQAKQGLKYLLWGMFMKLVIADRLGLFMDAVYANYIHYSGATCLVASVFYTLQIYTDFAGYTLMAIGIGRLLGFNIVNNFQRPYLSISITDFWRRWHISLSRWLKDYIYIPMGGSRCSKLRNYWNIFVTFLVSGIWHGANWTFIVWGILHGLFQIVEKMLGLQKYEGHNGWVRLVRICVTFCLVNFAWIFFRMPTLGDATAMLGQMVTDFGALDSGGKLSATDVSILRVSLLLLLFKDLRDEFFPRAFAWLQKPVVRWAAYVALFVMILSIGVLDSGQFIYVSF